MMPTLTAMRIGNMAKQANKNTHRILLVDDHEVMREAFARLIDNEPDLEVCGQASNAKEGFSLIQQIQPDLAVIDISLEGASGLELMKNAKAWAPASRMLALSMHDDTLFGERALQAGASGYVMKRADADTVLAAIRKVLDGETYLSDPLKARLVGRLQNRIKGPTGVESLSDRELEVFTHIGRGLSSAQTAASLNISPKTVETHRSRIKQKLNLSSGTELLRAAVSWLGNENQNLP